MKKWALPYDSPSHTVKMETVISTIIIIKKKRKKNTLHTRIKHFL